MRVPCMARFTYLRQRTFLLKAFWLFGTGTCLQAWKACYMGTELRGAPKPVNLDQIALLLVNNQTTDDKLRVEAQTIDVAARLSKAVEPVLVHGSFPGFNIWEWQWTSSFGHVYSRHAWAEIRRKIS